MKSARNLITAALLLCMASAPVAVTPDPCDVLATFCDFSGSACDQQGQQCTACHIDLCNNINPYVGGCENYRTTIGSCNYQNDCSYQYLGPCSGYYMGSSLCWCSED